ncbi:hypothetical protein [Vibrio ouci]|uniref:Uncharacterized protein n=1 Tax=Vibrio ouci TaxID=2499078 RepID=A0A4Y8WB94_9VIBR|nr:hypothetical protein [Vibrio ouci]TFH90172.1 hypothetical protein ELS82_18120 [Vibrio ouci]
MKNRYLALIAIAPFFIQTSVASSALTPNLTDGGNRWKLTSNHDAWPASNNPHYAYYCFTNYIQDGNVQYYSWVGETFSSSGYAAQKGSQIFMYGNGKLYAVGMNWWLVEANRGLGHMTSFFPANLSNGNFFNVDFSRAGNCKSE